MTTKFYGLTGGIGAGKSTVAKVFADLGVPTLDLDKVGRTLLNDVHIQQQLVQAFGAPIIQDGNISRDALRSIAFQSKANTLALNNIMHPAIRDAEMTWRNKQTAPSAIIEASVLIESGGVERMDGLIVVLADKDIRRQRVLKRPNFNAETFDNIVKQQTTDDIRKEFADMIIENNKDLSHLQEQVYHLYNRLTQHH